MNSSKLYPDIILVNGPSSAGKSTLSKALQDALDFPYLHFGFDDLIMMAPERYWKHAGTAIQGNVEKYAREGVQMIETNPPGEPPCVVAQFGPVFRHVIHGMTRTVAALVESGNAVIFDHVIHDQDMYAHCVEDFKPFKLFTVGVYCSLADLEKREQERGDRVLGRARGLADVVHSFCEYDVTVNTSTLSIQESVAKILTQLNAASEKKQ